jgi:undecaprenyl-diphosphatase
MEWFEAIILGLIQGLTEFLPVSSSGHLTIAKELFGIETHNLSFEVAVHAATVLSTIVVFRKEIWDLLKGLFKFKYNSQTEYICKIFVSMIPVMIIGFFFKDYVEEFFGSGLILVGSMLLITALLLFLSDFISRKRQKKAQEGHLSEYGKEVGYKEAVIIGVAQAIAVLPGLSRSGATISTGLLCGVKKSSVAQFSFLMVLIPILGEAFLNLVGGDFSAASSGTSSLSIIIGSLTAFVSGFAACRWMINIVKKAKLLYFSIYCAVVGILSIVLTIW